MQAFEVGDFRRVARLDECFKAGADQFRGAAAEHGLFAEQIALGLFLEGGLDDAGAKAADAHRIGQALFERLARGVLMHRHERRNADAIHIQFTDAVSGRLGRDHAYIDAFGGGELEEGAEIRFEVPGIEVDDAGDFVLCPVLF